MVVPISPYFLSERPALYIILLASATALLSSSAISSWIPVGIDIIRKLCIPPECWPPPRRFCRHAVRHYKKIIRPCARPGNMIKILIIAPYPAHNAFHSVFHMRPPLTVILLSCPHAPLISRPISRLIVHERFRLSNSALNACAVFKDEPLSSRSQTSFILIRFTWHCMPLSSLFRAKAWAPGGRLFRPAVYIQK